MGLHTPKRNTGMETEITHQTRCGLGERCCGSKYANMMPCKRLRVQAQLAMTLDELIEAEKLRRAVTAEKEEPEKKAAAPENHSDESDSAVNAASTQRHACGWTPLR
ncbi:unnamed protein product, partial [Durusdinium trenchii]